MIRMKVTWHYFAGVLFLILYKVVLPMVVLVNLYSQETFLAVMQGTAASTELHLAGKGCVKFVASQMSRMDSPCRAHFSPCAYM